MSKINHLERKNNIEANEKTLFLTAGSCLFMLTTYCGRSRTVIFQTIANSLSALAWRGLASDIQPDALALSLCAGLRDTGSAVQSSVLLNRSSGSAGLNTRVRTRPREKTRSARRLIVHLLQLRD